MLTNKQKIDAMLELLVPALVPYVEKEMASAFGEDRWRDLARLPKSLSRMADLDVYAALYALIHNWFDVFQNGLKPAARDAASATLAGRNAAAHSQGKLDDKVTLRALSGGAELLEHIGASDKAKSANKLYNDMLLQIVPQAKPAEPKTEPTSRPTLKLREQSAPPPPPVQGDLLGGGDVSGLTPWRKIMPPRPDVLSGRLNKDSFAANLAIADRDYRDGKETAYADPDAFFEATYLTRGLSLVLEKAGKRFTGGDAPSTIGLQTNFGGGKTHTLLSLLHMARLDDLSNTPALEPVRDAIDRAQLGEVRTAVFSGVDKGPDQPLDMAEGQAIRTLWGYIAWHLGGPEGLRLVKASEEAGTNPGAQVLQQLLEMSGKPSLVLLDELVAFVRQLAGDRFEAHLSFLQSLTEAAAQVPHALIVGSLPESEIEAGREQGREALRRLEKLFGRVQSAWEPAQGTETYAVVRRRLFQEIDDAGEREREKTIERFRKMYRDHKGDFPPGVETTDYREQMREAYPVHPMLFDLLATHWGPLEKFQRTRGVLALLARALYASYHSSTEEPLILPSSIRMDDPSVKGSLLEPLDGPAWSSIVDGEVDGDASLTWAMESRRPRYGEKHVARRAARTVFLATAPGDGAKTGMSGQELRLGCATPDEQISIFGDALRELSERSAHLYLSDNRYWYGSQPTLNKLAQQREADFDDAAADAEIVRLLKEDERPKGGWSRVSIAPDRALEASDEKLSRLVILGPSYPHGADNSLALAEARDGLERRSGGQRINRNSLIFLAAEEKNIDECRRLARSALAWRTIVKGDGVDLTESQQTGAQASFERAQKGLRDRIRKAWVQLLVPAVDPSDTSKVIFDISARRQEGGKTAAEHAWQVATQDGHITENLGPATLAERVMELWQDEHDTLSVDTVRDWYFEYLHMDRVRDESLIADAISDAASSLENPAFGLATETESELRDVSLSKAHRVTFGSNTVLVRVEKARTLLDEPEASSDGEEEDTTPGGGPSGEKPTETTKPKRFAGVVEVDPVRGAMTVNQIFENLIAELDRAPGAEIAITLEISAEAKDGFDSEIVDIVSDNAATLGFKHKDFRS